jgi:hypothetical protein
VDRQRIGLWGTFIFAALSVVGMFIQVYLIGGVVFGEGSGWLDAHKDLGMLVHLFYVLGSIQAFLAGGGNFASGDNGALHAFHAALVPIVFVIALWIAWSTWQRLQATQYQAPA